MKLSKRLLQLNQSARRLHRLTVGRGAMTIVIVVAQALLLSRAIGHVFLGGLTCDIAHGEMVALVGPSGAGKSTIAPLLLRFIESDSGMITVGGQPLTASDRAVWRAQIAWVPQRPYLFHGSVAENIRLAQPAASMAEIVAAAEAACAHTFITALPQSYDTPIGEQGLRLSGGERQPLALARAALKDAPILILDEPTAHLDTQTEQNLLRSLGALMDRRTTLMITHRLVGLETMDMILVLDRG